MYTLELFVKYTLFKISSIDHCLASLPIFFSYQRTNQNQSPAEEHLSNDYLRLTDAQLSRILHAPAPKTQLRPHSSPLLTTEQQNKKDEKQRNKTPKHTQSNYLGPEVQITAPTTASIATSGTKWCPSPTSKYLSRPSQ